MSVGEELSTIKQFIDHTHPDVLLLLETHMRTNTHIRKWPNTENCHNLYSSYPRERTRSGKTRTQLQRHNHNEAGLAIFVHNRWNPTDDQTTGRPGWPHHVGAPATAVMKPFIKPNIPASATYASTTNLTTSTNRGRLAYQVDVRGPQPIYPQGLRHHYIRVAGGLLKRASNQ